MPLINQTKTGRWDTPLGHFMQLFCLAQVDEKLSRLSRAIGGEVCWRKGSCDLYLACFVPPSQFLSSLMYKHTLFNY